MPINSIIPLKYGLLIEPTNMTNPKTIRADKTVVFFMTDFLFCRYKDIKTISIIQVNKC
jgi:hypothetical protein